MDELPLVLKNNPIIISALVSNTIAFLLSHGKPKITEDLIDLGHKGLAWRWAVFQGIAPTQGFPLVAAHLVEGQKFNLLHTGIVA